MNESQAEAYKAAFYPESQFGGFTDIDGTVAFYSRVNALLHSSFVVVDFGCGTGASTENDSVAFRRKLRCVKGKVSKVIGLDVNAAGVANAAIDEFRLLRPGSSWPLEDKSSNLINCDFVIEHLPDPPAFFDEAKRVLTTGGYLCIRTPNLFSYIGAISKFVPSKHHHHVLATAQPHRKAEDIFPTVYKCNTISALRRQMVAHGFSAVVYGYEAEPSYLNFSKVAYAMGVLHQKFAPALFKPTILAFGQLLQQ